MNNKKLFQNEGRYWAEKLQTDIILVPLMPDVDANFGVSLVLDFSTWWRHVKTIYILNSRCVGIRTVLSWWNLTRTMALCICLLYTKHVAEYRKADINVTCFLLVNGRKEKSHKLCNRLRSLRDNFLLVKHKLILPCRQRVRCGCLRFLTDMFRLVYWTQPTNLQVNTYNFF